MKKSPTSAPHSPQPSTSTSSPRHPDELEKDEQLQLCIQRFVSDAQSMIQEFNSLFIGEVRRFADVCIEFSLAYRSVHEERDFLAIENQSLKDELEARGGQLEMISKELRETREENEELVRRLECLGVPPGGSFESGGGSPILVGANSIRMDPVAMSRHYAVVNSMPAFPRRYSVATSVASYDDNAPTSYLSASHAGCSSASPTISYTGPNSATNSNTLLLITPPVDFKSGTTSPVSPLPEVPMEVKRKSASLSRDDIHAYFNKYNQQVVDTTKQRSPSLDQIPASSPIPIPDVQSPTDPLSMSSSAGTFYDCVSTCSMEVANPSNPQNLTEEINRMCALMVAQSGELTKEMPPMSQESTFSEYLERSDRQNSFIPKSPSLQSTNYLHHFQLYMSKSHDDAREAAFASGSELTEIETSSSGQIPRSNFQKKKNSIKDTASAAELIQETKWYSGHGTSGSLDLLDHSVYHREFPDLVTIIPLPLLELTRYLLVEVSHFISPSHFYLIVNDEKCGSNAFEDFLESFQNFYKSLDYLLEEEQQQQHQNGFVDDPDETEADSEWKLSFTSPRAPDAVTIGSYWAGYLMIYDDYEWRRIQVIQLGDDQADAKIELPEMMAITVRDVDSGYSTAISISALRPLTEEFGSIPAFAIRASLAYLYPRPHRSPSTGSLQPEDTASVWPEECCLLFEKLSYDRVLTASIIEIQREELTDTEIAQVLLWCSPSSGENQEDEIFINRKLIELNFAANVAEDDQWLLRSNESMNCASTKSSQILKQSEMQPEILPEAPTPELPDTPITKKKKLKKTTSKKKKESGHSVIPAVESEVIREDAPKPETLRPELYGEPNVLLGEPLTSSRNYLSTFDAANLTASTPMATSECTDSTKTPSKSNELFYFTVTFALIYLYFSYLNAF